MGSPLGIVAVIAMCVIFTAFQLARRNRYLRGARESLQRYAERNGFRFSADDAHRLADADLPLLRRGGGRRCTSVVSGHWQGLPFAAANYRYQEQAHTFLAIVVAGLDPRLRLPRTVISRRVVPEAFGDHLGLRPLWAGWEPFDRRFQIEASDGRLPGELIHPAMMQHLLGSLTTPAFRWEVAGSQLLVATFPRTQPTEDMLMEHIEPLLVAAKAFADRIVPVAVR